MVCQQYADDTQFYLSFHPCAMDVILSLEHCLAAVLELIGANRLRLNPDKMEVLWVSVPAACTLGASLSFRGVILSVKDEV